MIFPLGYKKIFFAVVLVIFFSAAKSQLRTNGYYLNTTISKEGDTTFYILCFTPNGSWTDTSGTGVAPGMNQMPAGRSNERCTYARNGNELTLTIEPINLPLYTVSDCPSLGYISPCRTEA